MIAAAFLFFITAHAFCVLMFLTHLREERARQEAEIHRYYSNLTSSHLNPL